MTASTRDAVRGPLLPRGLGSLGAALLVLLVAGEAHADRGELLVGAAVAGELPAAAGADLTAQLGLGDAIALRASAGGRYAGEHGGGIDALVGLVVTWDVLAWVPELAISAGARADDGVVGQGQLALSMRRYTSLDTSISITVGGGFRWEREAYGIVTVALWRRFD